MNYQLIGLALATMGEVLLGITVILVHIKLKKEKKIDRFVIKQITIEETLGVLAVIMMIIGFIMQAVNL